MKATGGQTEGFLEGVEPQITELLSALGCEPSDEEEEISLEISSKRFPPETTPSRVDARAQGSKIKRR